MAKSNVYRYFDSREEIFLQLLLEDWEDWAKEVERKLAPLSGKDDAAAVASVLASTCSGRPPAANPKPDVAKILTRPEFAVFQVDFEADLRRGVLVLIEGLRASPEA